MEHPKAGLSADELTWELPVYSQGLHLPVPKPSCLQTYSLRSMAAHGFTDPQALACSVGSKKPGNNMKAELFISS